MRALIAVLLALIIGACATPAGYYPSDDPNFIELDEIPGRASDLHGQRIRTYGLVLMNERSRNLVSKRGIDGQICIGLLVTAEELKRLRTYDGKWLVVEGRFDKEGCGGNTICHDSCGPYTISDPVLSSPR
jgi:hypothetical protein